MNDKTLSKTGAIIALIIILLVAWLATTIPASTTEAYPPPGAEPTSRPWAPDYPDPCHEHGGPWDPMAEFFFAYLPAVSK